MKIIQMSVAAILLVSAGVVFAQPAIVDGEQFICPDFTVQYEEYLAFEDFCYRVEVTCGDGIGGGVDTTLSNDGGVGIGMGVFAIQGEEECGGGFGHLGNSQFTHSCFFNSGEGVELKVKAVNLSNCENDESSNKVKMCHVPPGNHYSAHVILVSQKGVRAHLAHSGESFDYLLLGGPELYAGEYCDPYAGIN